MPPEKNSSDIFEEIDENLRKAYAGLLNEDLPHRFHELLQKLREQGAEFEAAIEQDGGDQ